jgi:hypothetical protein
MIRPLPGLLLLLAWLSACAVPPAPVQIPAASPAPGLDIYTNPDYGLRLALPAGYLSQALDVPPGALFRVGFAAPQEAPSSFPLRLTVYQKPAGTPLPDWLSANSAGPGGKALFVAPLIVDRQPRLGLPALQYESGELPVWFETLFDRGDHVVGLAYPRDWPLDYADAYAQALDTMALSPPQVALPAQPPASSPTAPACLAAGVPPISVPERGQPLIVAYTHAGGVWTWEEPSPRPRLLVPAGDARTPQLSPDGAWIAFQRWPEAGYAGLWGVRRSGSDPVQLVGLDEVRGLASDPGLVSAWVDVTGWPAADRLEAVVSGAYDGIGGCCTELARFAIDLASGQRRPSAPPAPLLDGLISPDGSLLALPGDYALHLAAPDGAVLHPAVLSYPYVPVEEGGGRYGPWLAWAADSQSLVVLTASPNHWDFAATFQAWRLPADGSPAAPLGTFNGYFVSAQVSPGLEFLVYLRAPQPTSNLRQVRLARLDGAADLLVAEGEGLELLGWTPDGAGFLYRDWITRQVRLGSLCGSPQPLLQPADLAVERLDWVDGRRFLLVAGRQGGPRYLQLGEPGAAPRLIGPFEGEGAAFDFNRP